MFKCEDCNNTFDEPETLEEKHPYQESFAVEYWAVCPCCGSVNFEEIIKEDEEEC